jgi:Family of unknown function (DUF5309)
MATIQGTRYTDSDTANVAIDMSDTLSMISPSDVPLLSLIGKDSLAKSCVAVKHEWLEASLRPLDGTFQSGQLANVTDPVTANITVGQGVRVIPGDILKVESELLRVTTVAVDAITLARGFGGSTPASHAGVIPWSIAGHVDLQDAGVPVARSTTKTGLFNYCQIYNASIRVTTTMQAIEKYVQQDDFASQIADELKVAWQTWERAILYGRKVQPTSVVAGAMDGIFARIATNVYAKAGSALIEDFVLQALQDCWTAGGEPQTVVGGAFQKRRFNQFNDGLRETTRTDKTAGAVVNRYESDFGEVDYVLDRNMPADSLLVLDKNKIGFGPLRNHAMKWVPIPLTTGLVETSQLLGQYTMELRNESAHAAITGLATS